MIYIDGVEYLKSDNEHVRESVINYLDNWNITVSTSGTTGKPKTYQHSEKLMRQVAEYNAEYFMLDSNSSMMALYNPTRHWIYKYELVSLSRCKLRHIY